MTVLLTWLGIGLLSVLTLLLGGDSLSLMALPVFALFLIKLLDYLPRDWTSRLPSKIHEAAGPVLIVALAIFFYGRLLIGDFPVNHDHPVMLLRAWITGTQMIPSGSFTGFSATMFAGYPANSLYSMGTDLLVCLFRYLSLGLLSWETAYCWALFLFVVAYPLALYAVGRRFAGPLAGIVAGLLGMFDRGFWFQSGWDFNLNWGVWSMGFAFTMCLTTILYLDRLLEKWSTWNFCATALSMGFAILFHPMAVAILGLVLPILVLVNALTGRVGAPGLWIPRMVGACLTGVGLAAFWLIPFISRQAWFEPLADPWVTFQDALIGLLNGNLLAQFSPVLLLAGVLGLIIGTVRRHSFSWFLLVSSGLLLFFASNTFLLTFDILKKFPALSNLQPQRFAYFIRTALLVGCGFLVHYVVQFSKTRPGAAGFETPFRRHGRRLLLALAIAPFLFFIGRVGPSAYLAPAKPLTWSSESSLYEDLRSAAEFLSSQDPRTLDRIAVVAITNEHLLLNLPVYTGLDIFKVGFTPENNYRYKFESRNPEVFKAVNVSHVLSVGPMHRPELEELKVFGRLFLYRFRDYSPDRVTLLGPGQARVERDEPEALDVQLSGTAPESRLIIHKARYALWEAEQNGKSLPIRGTSIGDSPEVFMKVPVEDGLLTLRYRSGAPEVLGALLSWLSWIALGLLIASRFIQRLNTFLARTLAKATGPLRDAVTLVTLALAALGLLVVVLRLVLPGTLSFPNREVVTDLNRRLPQARGEVVRSTRTLPCTPYDGTMIKCPGPAWNHAAKVIITADQLLRQCIWLHPIQGAKFTLHFEDVELGDYIQGNFAIADVASQPPSNHHVNLTVYLDDTELGKFTCPSRRGWFDWEVQTPGRRGTKGKVSIASDAPFTGRRHFCFTAATTVDD